MNARAAEVVGVGVAEVEPGQAQSESIAKSRGIPRTAGILKV